MLAEAEEVEAAAVRAEKIAAHRLALGWRMRELVAERGARGGSGEQGRGGRAAPGIPPLPPTAAKAEVAASAQKRPTKVLKQERSGRGCRSGGVGAAHAHPDWGRFLGGDGRQRRLGGYWGWGVGVHGDGGPPWRTGHAGFESAAWSSLLSVGAFAN
jgi:hypothetical protein